MDFDQIYALILTGIITPLVGYAVSKLFALLDEKLDTVKNEKTQKALRDARIEMEAAVKKAIIQVNETYVNALKADGAFTEEDARLALAKSIDITKNIMSDAALNALANSAIAIDEAIKTEIEVQLPVVKTDIVATVTAAPRSVEITDSSEVIFTEVE